MAPPVSFFFPHFLRAQNQKYSYMPLSILRGQSHSLVVSPLKGPENCWSFPLRSEKLAVSEWSVAWHLSIWIFVSFSFLLKQPSLHLCCCFNLVSWQPPPRALLSDENREGGVGQTCLKWRGRKGRHEGGRIEKTERREKAGIMRRERKHDSRKKGDEEQGGSLVSTRPEVTRAPIPE